MPTPSKPLHLVNGHINKDVRKRREEAEKSLVTGESMREWPGIKDNPVAHKHWLRVVRLLEKINKNDALIEVVINRYCLLLEECDYLDRIKRDAMTDLEALLADDSLNFLAKMEIKDKLIARYTASDKSVMTKRKMLLDIERENIMTIAAQLRTIPKAPDKPAAPTGMAALLKKRAEGGGV